MARAVLDTAVLISALLKPIAGGARYDLLESAEDKAFKLFLSPDILEETTHVLLTRVHSPALFLFGR
jgi:predicted nucleic acid-binding protein